MNQSNKYNREIIGLDGVKTTIDIYRILVAFDIKDPEIQHAVKKILCAGLRGKGSIEQDVSEAILSIQKYQERLEHEAKYVYSSGYTFDSDIGEISRKLEQS